MEKRPSEILLRRIDPSLNMARFYVLSIQPNLFGGSSVVREWGRIGTRGQFKVELADDRALAEQRAAKIERSKRRRGYCDTGTPPAP
jgi:predicted DNA-binding WGR domain protein